jgi:protocatechuate 3,4-dioxygenase beta subunit
MTVFELSRRRVLGLGGAGVAGLALGSAAPGSAPALGATRTSCVLASHVAEGPYRPDPAMRRRDITEGRRGVPLTLRLAVRDTAGTRAPVPGAVVEIWHCDAWGYYSGYAKAYPGGEVPAADDEDGSGADPATYLRGHQLAGRDGTVGFATIVPGWYAGRAPHIHVSVRTGPVSHTGQLFFDDALIERVHALSPYTRHTGGGPAALADDPVYGGGGARDGLLRTAKVTRGRVRDGCVAMLTLGVAPAQER